MEQAHVSADKVEAQDSCVSYNHHLEISPGTIAGQPAFAPIRRRELMAAVNTVAKDFGLRASSVVVLDALLSCLPCRDEKTGRDAPITNRMLLTVFASNDTLCFRAKGLTDRQLRRHLERLERVGLIRRRDSANGKRFPIYRNGRITAAFGIDLSPLLELSGKVLDLARKARETAAELQGVKARIHKVRAMCIDLALDETTKCFVESVGKTLRRVGTTVNEAKAILASLLALIEQNNAQGQPAENNPNLTPISSVEASKTPAIDGQNVRHKEPEKADTKKTSRQNDKSEDWRSLSNIPDFFPDPPTNNHMLLGIIYDFGRMLGLDHNLLATGILRLGPQIIVALLDSTASKIASIDNITAYFSRIVENLSQRKVGHGQLQLNAS